VGELGDVVGGDVAEALPGGLDGLGDALGELCADDGEGVPALHDGRKQTGYVQNTLIRQLVAENVRAQGLYLVRDGLRGEDDVGEAGAAEGDVLPGGDLDGDAAEHVEAEVLEPGVDDEGVGVPGLEGARVDPALKVLLGLFVGKGAADDGPERAAGGEGDGAGGGDVEGGGGVGGEVGEEVEEGGLVRAHLDAGDGDGVGRGALWRAVEADGGGGRAAGKGAQHGQG